MERIYGMDAPESIGYFGINGNTLLWALEISVQGPLYHDGYGDGRSSANTCRSIISKMKTRKELIALAGRCLRSEELIVDVFRGGDIRYKTGFFDGWLDTGEMIMGEK